MATRGSGLTATGLAFILIAVSVGVSSTGGFALLLSFAGVLAGASLIFVGIRIADDPTAPVGHPGLLTAGLRCLRRNLALVGLFLASAASSATAAAVAGRDREAAPVLCFCAFALMLLGLSLLNIGDGKNAHLMTLEDAGERLQLVNADMLDYDSVASAVAGCEGVFHVASPVPSGQPSNPEADVIAPAVTGTQNVLKACYEAKVKRVVVVSSVAAVFNNPNWPKGEAFTEDSWSDAEHCRKNEEWYFLSKTLAEHEAFAYAAKNGLDIVTICPSWVIGPLLQPTVNASLKIFLRYIKGDQETVRNGPMNLVDVRDVADALLLAYENPQASGRYLCSSTAIRVSDIVNILKTSYPTHNYPQKFVEVEGSNTYITEKLRKLGWTSRPMEETLRDSVECYRALGIMN